MVLFLLHNTLGAWWAGKVLAAIPNLAKSAPDEAALRAACKVGDIDWTYLRFVRDTAEVGTDGPWRPAAGVFEGWPKAAKDVTVLDPCMGSGHFLVFALPIFVAFRMAEEGLSQSAAVDAALMDNLFGLEIDPRCTQIAAFNLAFAAWRKVGHRPLPQLNLACSGLAIGVTKAEWLMLAEQAVMATDPAAKRGLLGVEQNLLTVGLEERVKNGLGALYDLFAKPSWGRSGIALSLMGDLPATIYTGEIYDKDCCAIVPKDDNDLPALVSLFMSGHFSQELRKFDKSLKVDSPKTLLSVPCDLEYWREKAADDDSELFRPPLVIPASQWVFSGHPKNTSEPLSTAVGRLAGFRWPRQQGSGFVGFPPISEDGLESHSDDDGIVCLAALKGEPLAEQRLNTLLADAFGADWSAAKLSGLLAEAGYAGKSLDDWLRDGFFAQHCELFHQRPFVWHIWDGRRDGFHALVNYHRLAAPDGEGRRTLEKLIYSYLGDWIDDQRKQQQRDVEGADARLAHAEHLKAELIKILDGEPPYDLFVRWKPLHEQPIGWDPDINDGVRMNIRPFMAARTLNARGANACILRTTPKIKWDKDRGKEPTRDKADYPWFWGWDEATTDFDGGATFDGNRWNDLHFSRAVKQAARDRFRAKSGAKP